MTSCMATQPHVDSMQVNSSFCYYFYFFIIIQSTDQRDI